MLELTKALNAATAILQNPATLAAQQQEFTTRDWAAFFDALAKFLAAFMPLIIPLFVTPEAK
jgi:hypothetical protein